MNTKKAFCGRHNMGLLGTAVSHRDLLNCAVILIAVCSYACKYFSGLLNYYYLLNLAGFFKPEVVSAFNSQLNGRLQARPAADYLFRSISGSGLRSPRCRYGGDACVVLRYFRSGWYLVRTLRPRRLDASRAPAPDDVRRQRCFRFYVLRQLNDVVPSASFDWILTE